MANMSPLIDYGFGSTVGGKSDGPPHSTGLLRTLSDWRMAEKC